MQRVFVTYRLKQGVEHDDFAKFSRDLDQVITAHRPGVLRFEVHRVEGAASGVEGVACDRTEDIVETIDVASWEAWMAAVRTPEMAPVREAFTELVDLDSVRMTWGSPI
jgi:hypothetical protein